MRGITAGGSIFCRNFQEEKSEAFDGPNTLRSSVDTSSSQYATSILYDLFWIFIVFPDLAQAALAIR